MTPGSSQGRASDREPIVSWRDARQAIARGIWPLLAYEALVSWLMASVLGPLSLVFSYRLIEWSGEPVLGNAEIARYWLSPLGLASLVLVLGATLALVLVEYSGLIVLVHAALRRETPSIAGLLAAVVVAAPRLFGLAVVQLVCALLVALPFVAVAAAAYWLLLSGSDINFYLAERPPRFWLAALIGLLLLAGLAISVAWFFVGWAFAVPACVIERQGALAALRTSSKLRRAEAWRLLVQVVGWQVLRLVALWAVLVAFDRLNAMLLGGTEEPLTSLVAATGLTLLLEVLVLQWVGGAFAIGTALIVAVYYRRAGAARTDQAGSNRALDDASSPRVSSRVRVAIVALIFVVPAVSVYSALELSHQFVEHRIAKVTAHRAGSKLAPENSIGALRRSMAAGADYVEIDVQLTADDQVVLVHDRDLRRVTGDRRVVSELSLADLRGLRLLTADGPSEERIPTLAEFLDACDDRIRLNVELKVFGDGPGLALAVLEVLRERDMIKRAVVSSFELAPLGALKQAEPEIPVGAILSAIRGDATRFPVDFLSVHERLARGELVRRAHQRGQEVHVWGVGDRPTALRLLDLGCDNLITADPVTIREVVDRYAALGDAQRMLLRIRRWLRD